MALNSPHSKLFPTEYIAEWCQVTPYHSVNNIYKAIKLWIRLAWLIIVLFAGFLAFYQSSMLIMDYVNGEAQSWVTVITDEMPKSGGLDWPNMTICNYAHRFNSILESQNLTDPYEIAYDGAVIDGTDPLYQAMQFYKDYQETRDIDVNITQLLERFKTMGRLYNIQGLTLSQALIRYGRKCNETVVDCGYIDRFSLHERMNCCDMLYKVRLQNCVSLHPSLIFPKRQVLVAMNQDGIYYLFNPKVNDYYDEMFLHKTPGAGLRIMLYNGVFEGTTPETVYAAPGTHTLVQLTAEKRITVVSDYQMIPFYKRQKSCIDSQPYLHIDYPYYYRLLCLLDCKIEWHMHECKCTVETTRIKQGRECIGDRIAVCVQREKIGINRSIVYKDGFNMAKCENSCQDECDSRKILASASHSQFPAPKKLKAFTTYMNKALPFLGSNYTEEDAKQLILFEMSYQSVNYRVISEVEKTTIGTFVSNIGGALGVWTGLSLLSIFQAGVYVCLFIGKFLRRLYEKVPE